MLVRVPKSMLSYLLPAVAMLAACSDPVRVDLPAARVDLDTAAGAVEGWLVSEVEVGVDCPDGRPSRFLFVHPQSPEGPLPTAVVYHSGAFDFVNAPALGRPLVGQPYRPEEGARIDLPFGVRMAYSTVGLVPSPADEVRPTGAMVVALAERDIASIVPTNCWGDLWHNKPAVRENDFFGDQFFRAGGVLGEWAYRLAAEPDFADLVDIDLPYEPDTSRVALVGFGEGGRAVAERVSRGDVPDVVVLDSHADDLQALLNARADMQVGLARIYRGDLQSGQLSDAPVLPPTFWVGSEADPLVPVSTHVDLLSRLNTAEHETVTLPGDSRGVSNRDSGLANQAATFVSDAF